jgi:hypothetical protein
MTNRKVAWKEDLTEEYDDPSNSFIEEFLPSTMAEDSLDLTATVILEGDEDHSDYFFDAINEESEKRDACTATTSFP